MALRMPLIDVVHRTLLFGLIGMGAGGIVLGYSSQLVREMEIQKEAALADGKQIEDEKALAEAAQRIPKSRNT
ncbi:uncharacterized protein FOMMEDRAFT_164833 [Fomitiporia mediterranea MF3/22]|uniref:uncharacterized protein n=1 Tax=Fomitiporia mediterranea (strain MF3/22) TaxID=694068 RepID=UPI00044093E8|nr:uncharacterized protein FOMMEDRAFT_164833 [Fomitiporia mediterranea MF3/22]EJD08082.1 hypothetical protein FOMMEDRAFT_164833 [Fomitiporia mediterranea MF3/22]